VELAGITTFRGLVRATAAVIAEAYAHPDLALEILMERAAGVTGGARVPAFQVTFLVRQGSGADSLDFPGIRAESVPVDIGMSPFELMLEFDDPGPGRPLTGKLEYRTVRFEPETIRRIADGYLAVLGQGVANPEHVPSPTDSLLPAPARIQAAQASPGPRGGAGLSETGTALSDLWRNVLGEVEVGPLDNFYDLGGTPWRRMA
jgi:non-ribosomal peptide synthetase component F